MTTPGHNMPQHEGNITMTQTSNRHHPQRALVVIDVQNEYVTGNLRIEYPPVEDSLRNIGKAIDGARSAGIPVVVVQQMSPTTAPLFRSEEHTSELQSLMRISYAVFCLKKKKTHHTIHN